MIDPAEELRCTQVWGGRGSCDVSLQLVGARGECWSRVFRDGAAGGDIHFLSVCELAKLTKVVLADVSGHGVESAEVSTIIHDALIESIGARDNSTMMEYVNDAFLKRRTGIFKFTTMAAMIIDSQTRSLVYAYAGHPAILRGTPRTGTFAPVRPEAGRRGGIPIGVMAGAQVNYEQHSCQLEAGDVLVVYTDAFTEAPAADDGLIGEAGLARLLEGARSMRPRDLKSHVLGCLGDHYEDDASLIILEIL